MQCIPPNSRTIPGNHSAFVTVLPVCAQGGFRRVRPASVTYPAAAVKRRAVLRTFIGYQVLFELETTVIHYTLNRCPIYPGMGIKIGSCFKQS